MQWHRLISNRSEVVRVNTTSSDTEKLTLTRYEGDLRLSLQVDRGLVALSADMRSWLLWGQGANLLFDLVGSLFFTENPNVGFRFCAHYFLQCTSASKIKVFWHRNVRAWSVPLKSAVLNDSLAVFIIWPEAVMLSQGYARYVLHTLSNMK
jgi:hypothetical protein